MEKGIFSLDGGLMGFLNKVSDIVIISVYWLICCLPIVTIGASTTAAYYTIVKVVRRQIGTLSREFFRSFKDNFKQASIVNLIYLILEGILAFNVYTVYHALGREGSGVEIYLFVIYVMMFILVFGAAIYTYPILSRFDMKITTLFKFSFFTLFRHIPTSIALIVLFTVSIAALVLIPVGVIFMPGICLFVYSILMERILRRYMSPEMLKKWDEMAAIESEILPDETQNEKKN